MTTPAARPLRVLYVTPFPQSVIEEKILVRLAADPRLELHVATCAGQPWYQGLEEVLTRRHEAPFRRLHINLPGLRRLCFAARQRLLIGYLRRLHREHRFDVIHAGWLTADAWSAAKAGVHPLLARSWGSDVLDDPTMRNAHHSPYLRRRLQYTAAHADACYCDAQHVANTLVQLAGIAREKIRVFPQFGADTTLFRPAPELRAEGRRRLAVGDRKVIFNLRTLGPVYAIDDLIKAMPAVVAAEPQALLVLLGKGPLKAELEALTQALGMTEHVRFAAGGFIPTEELPCYYNAADIYVSTSLSDGTSLSLLEAMGCALPVVVTDVPSITEWITDGHNGRVVPRRQPAAVAQALIELLGAPERRRLFGERNRELAVARGDSTANYEQLVALYQHLAAQAERD